MSAKSIPDGYHSVQPYLSVDGAAEAIDWYKQALGATERYRMNGPDGKIGHAELQIGDSVVLLADPYPQGSTKPPKELGGTTFSLMVYVEDVDSTVKQAVDAGATVTMEVTDQFWGDRFGSFTDPFGHSWSIATHIEDVAPDEMEKRAAEFMAEAGAGS
jgi:PhnB protein